MTNNFLISFAKCQFKNSVNEREKIFWKYFFIYGEIFTHSVD